MFEQFILIGQKLLDVKNIRPMDSDSFQTGADDKRPKIQLSLKYNNRTKTLSVVVHRIKNLVSLKHLKSLHLIRFQFLKSGKFSWFYTWLLFSNEHSLKTTLIRAAFLNRRVAIFEQI